MVVCLSVRKPILLVELGSFSSHYQASSVTSTSAGHTLAHTGRRCDSSVSEKTSAPIPQTIIDPSVKNSML